MFKHGKTNKTYYSVFDKIKYYRAVLSGKVFGASPDLKDKAKRRLKELEKIKESNFTEPDMVVVDDAHFGNGISKPRLCVAYGIDSKGRVQVHPVNKREISTLVLEYDASRQVGSKFKPLDRSDIYEAKYINASSLSDKEKRKIKSMWKK